jgi:hypothetical protein
MTNNTLPPFLMTLEEGSFARKTIEERKPIIIDRILSHFDYTPQIREDLQRLKSELAHGKVQPLREETSDRSIWDEDISSWLGKTWLELPWFLAETYFYRRVLEAVRYFQPGPWMGQDPYQRFKQEEMSQGLAVFSRVYQGMPDGDSLKDFQEFCYRVLWSNRGDLANLSQFDTNMDAQRHNIILDHSQKVYYLMKEKIAKTAYIFDNVGKELFFDLSFIDYLLESDLAESFTCYLKNQPFFVSDAMVKDLERTLYLLKASQSEKDRDLAERITHAQKSGQIKYETPPFFAFGRMFRQLPEILNDHLSSHNLVILKGDVNYRRLMGDRHWPPTTPIEKAAGYFPTNVLSFRTLKAELVVGLDEDTLRFLDTEGENGWRINGKRGMITFLEKI